MGVFKRKKDARLGLRSVETTDKNLPDEPPPNDPSKTMQSEMPAVVDIFFVVAPEVFAPRPSSAPRTARLPE